MTDVAVPDSVPKPKKTRSRIVVKAPEPPPRPPTPPPPPPPPPAPTHTHTILSADAIEMVRKEAKKRNGGFKTGQTPEHVLANLRKGMEKMKANREQRKIEKEERGKQNAILKERGEPLIPEPRRPVYVKAPRPVIVEEQKIRKPREKKPVDPDAPPKPKKKELRDEIAELKTIMTSRVVPEPSVVLPVERIVEKVVEKQRLVSGSDMLNSIFFK